jgi:hypothetical protein
MQRFEYRRGYNNRIYFLIERQWHSSLSFFLQQFRRGILQKHQNEEKEIIPWRDNLFFFALEQECRDK